MSKGIEEIASHGAIMCLHAASCTSLHPFSQLRDATGISTCTPSASQALYTVRMGQCGAEITGLKLALRTKRELLAYAQQRLSQLQAGVPFVSHNLRSAEEVGALKNLKGLLMWQNMTPERCIHHVVC